MRRLHPSIQIKKTGLLFSAPPSLSSWELIGKQLLAIVDSSTWWIADWLAYGEAAFRDRYAEAIGKTSLNYQTLRNYAWVARRFELSRRRERLSFGHHAEVAALDAPEQDYWLRKAEELGWSRNQLRVQVRTSLRERSAAGAGKNASGEDGTLRLVLTSDQITLFESIACARNMELHEWAVQELEAAARNSRAGVPPAGHRRPYAGRSEFC